MSGWVRRTSAVLGTASQKSSTLRSPWVVWSCGWLLETLELSFSDREALTVTDMVLERGSQWSWCVVQGRRRRLDVLERE